MVVACSPQHKWAGRRLLIRKRNFAESVGQFPMTRNREIRSPLLRRQLASVNGRWANHAR
jgi:hypothetical protein